MLSIVIELTIRGTLVSGLVWLLELMLAARIQARSRRVWWALAALAFLLPLRLPILPVMSAHVHELSTLYIQPELSVDSAVSASVPMVDYSLIGFVGWLWLAGATISLALVLFQTVRTARRWSRERLCTNPELLNLLEDCKAAANVTAPIGLVLSDIVSTPALLGWLRPRILLPNALATSLSESQLRAVLLHELAHFRALDVPMHWLFALARVIHWFNPIMHLTIREWLRHRELAADETALGWLTPHERPAYGHALLQALKHAHNSPPPYGAFALGETVQNLKQRLAMLSCHSSLARRRLLALAISLFLAAAAFLQPARADQPSDAKTAAAAETESWLKTIDDGHYDASWENASVGFKKSVTKEKWQEMSKQVRSPLGRCLSRKLTSSRYQLGLPVANGEKVEGEFVVSHYESSFEKLNVLETLFFKKDPDGAWRAVGYFVQPN